MQTYSILKSILQRLILHNKNEIKENITLTKLKYPWVIVSFNNLIVQTQDNKAMITTLTRLEFDGTNNRLAYDLYDLELEWLKINNDWFIHSVKITPTKP